MDKNLNSLISVVMPVYNGEQYLREAIESILNQSYTNFEFIIVNDGSTDKTEEIILSYTDPRIKYIKQNNFGVGYSLRVGCSISKGKYIARMDADDVSLLNRFVIQKNILDLHDSIVLVGGAVNYIDKDGVYIGRSFPVTSLFAIIKKIKKGSPICHPSVMMRRDIYEKVGGYMDLEPLEDLFLWMNLGKHGVLKNISTPLINYRVLKNSVSRSISDLHYNLLIQELNILSDKYLITENDLMKFKLLYKSKKSEIKDSLLEESKVNINTLKSRFEINVDKAFQKIFLPLSIREFLICNLKNIIAIFQN